MAPSNPDSYVLQEPKTRLHPGITGPKMAADTPYREPEPEPQPSDHKDPTAADSYSGLEVVETGIEVVPPSPLPEALSPPHHQQQQLPQMQYAEYKPWAQQYSPPEPLPPNPGYPPQPATAPDYRYNGGHNPFEPPGGGRICGLRKVVFWAALAIAAFAVVAAVAVGLGVGLGTRSSAGAPTATSSAAPTVTNSLPAATATSTAGPEVSIVCPSANLTLYSLAGSSSSSSSTSSAQEFLVFCGRDYNNSGGAEDMVSMNTTTFEACLEECANQEGCVAVGWGNYYGLNTCWLKSAIGEPNWSEGWYSAVAT